jgi:hypothetical protein
MSIASASLPSNLPSDASVCKAAEQAVDSKESILATGSLAPSETLSLPPRPSSSSSSSLERHQQALHNYQALHAPYTPCFEDVTMLPGHVHNLDAEQAARLQVLWVMLLRLLSDSAISVQMLGEFETRSWKHKVAHMRSLFLQTQPFLPEGFFDPEGVSVEGCAWDAFVLDWERLLESVFSVSDLEVFWTRIEENPLASVLFAQISAEDPDTLLLRFLRARKWHIVEAAAKLFDTLCWHRSFGVRELMEQGETALPEHLLRCGKHYAWNVDVRGRLVVWITSRLHDKNLQTLHQNLQALVFLVEQARRLMAPGTETVTLVFDLADAPLAALDLPSIQGDIHVLQSYYPECLGACYIVDAPWIFHGLYSLVRTFLDPAVVAKISLLRGSELVEHIHPRMVPPRYAGGCDPLTLFVHTIEQPPVPACASTSAELSALQDAAVGLRRRLLETTLTSTPAEAFAPDGARAAIRADLVAVSRELEHRTWPRSHYHRCGVLDEARPGPPNWLGQ